MVQSLNVRLKDDDVARLRKIAARVGALAPSGLAQGQPSISRMLMMIAKGELTLTRGEPTHREVWNRYASNDSYLVEIRDGHVVAAAGPASETEVINRWPAPYELVNNPALAAELDQKRGEFQRAVLPIPSGTVTAPRELRDDDRLLVRPHIPTRGDDPAGMVTIEGPQLDHVAHTVLWSGGPITSPTWMTYAEIRDNVSDSAARDLNRAASYSCRLGYGGTPPVEVRQP